MGKIAVVTDSNSGITQEQANELGVFVLPMPVIIDSKIYYEGTTINRKQFYEKLPECKNVSTSQPSPEDTIELWNALLKDYDAIVHIPMSCNLSGGFQTSMMLSNDFDGKVHVVNNQRISVTQRQSVLDALELIKRGMSAQEIKEFLEKDKFNSSIYIMVDTLYYLRKGGRITPAAAALGTLLKLKPVLQIQGEKIDAFAKARTPNQGKSIMINAIKDDVERRFGGVSKDNGMWLQIAHTESEQSAEALKQELLDAFPDYPVYIDHLPLNVACHTGPGALGIACCKKITLP